MKTWINKEETGDNFVVFDNNILYRRSVKKDKFASFEQELSRGNINEKFIGLPVGYMKQVEYRDDDKMLRISYGTDSVDSLEIKDQAVRKEVFEYLKSNTKIKKNYVEQPSVLSRIKKPLIALFVVVGIFAYVYFVIDGLNQGYEYEIVGGGVGLGGVVLGLAELGLLKNLFIFAPLALIALFRINMNLNDNSEIHYIEY